jgi:hypothetical protein
MLTRMGAWRTWLLAWMRGAFRIRQPVVKIGKTSFDDK